MKRNSLVLGITLLILAIFAWAGWANWEFRRQAAERRLAQAAHAELIPANSSDGDAMLTTSKLVGNPAPEFALEDLNGRKVSLADYKGKAVLINFWATWCGPCQEELPRLAKLAEAYAGKPVAFVLISIDDPKDRTKIPAVLARLHVARESWVNADTDTMDGFGLGDIVPGTAILDQDGQIVSRIMGEARDADVRTAVDWLLSGRSGAAPAEKTKRY